MKENRIIEIGNITNGGSWNSPQHGRVYSVKGVSPTLRACSGGDLEPKILQTKRGFNKGNIYDITPTVSSSSFIENNFLIKNYRIRKLTERECFRLMDVADDDIDKIQKTGISRTQQYKMAGNSIVVSCLYHIFDKMFIHKDDTHDQLTLF